MQRLGQALTTSPSHRHISLCWSDAEEEESSDECGAGTVCYWSTDYSESDIECCCLALRKVGLEGWNGIRTYMHMHTQTHTFSSLLALEGPTQAIAYSPVSQANLSKGELARLASHG